MKTTTKFAFAILVFSTLLFSGCKEDTFNKKSIKGFNVKWRSLPDVSNQLLINNIIKLETEMVRYPGGTVTHKWDWKTGKAFQPIGSDHIHPIKDISTLVTKTGVKILFVLDIVNKDIDDQIDMLNAANVPIEYIELGNELYAKDIKKYEKVFPTGKEYADTVNTWVPKLKKKFPNAKISACLAGKTFSPTKNLRQYNWNKFVRNNITADIDAFSYHIYIKELNDSAKKRIEEFEKVFIKNSQKETWISEYGAKNQNLKELLKLADYVESIADISLNHVLISTKGNFSKLSADGHQFTTEGKAYIDRVNN